jgi:[ribosomal protein S18]-alanine N-acetyltransferase
MPGMKKIPEGIRIRKAVASDIEAVSRIENGQFPNPWKKKYFIDELTHDIANFYVAEDVVTRDVAGYIIFWIVEDMLELHKIAVSGEYKGKGIGKELFGFMMDTAKERKIAEVFLEVRKTNTVAIKLYESFGFVRIDVRKDYYKEPLEDALVFKF